MTAHVEGRRPAKAFGIFRYGEVRVQAMLLAAVLWGAAAVTTFASPGYRTLTGRLKCADFIQFYTLGHIAFDREYPRIATVDALHRLQVQLLPASDPELYFPVYPPQTAIIFAPLALLSYGVAAALWALILVSCYAAIVWYTWRSVRDVFPDKAFVAAAAAAFPPFWSLVQHGQTTIFPLVGFFFGWLALERRRPFLGGVALGLLAVKPQFGIVLAIVVLATGEWRMMFGALCSVALQVCAVIYLMGFQAVTAYIDNVRRIRAVEPLLEPDPWQMHSLRTITNLVPGVGGMVLWVLLSAAVIALVVMVWRTGAAVAARLGVLVVGTVLVNPHVIVYDATILVLPLLWLGAWIGRNQLSAATSFGPSVYALFVFLLLPTARLVYVQASVLVLAWIFWRVSRFIYLETGNKVPY